MRKLFLASQFNKVADLTRKFFDGLDLSEIKIAYIPNALSNKEAEQRSSYQALKSLGCEVIVTDIEKLEFNEVKNILGECQAIFGAGGDPVYLVDKLRENGIDKLLIQEIQKGKYYLGSSAGSMIMGEKIKTSKHLGEESRIGLALVNFSILPHWGEDDDEDYRDKKVQLIQESFDEKMSIMTLTDDQVIVVENEKIEIWNN